MVDNQNRSPRGQKRIVTLALIGGAGLIFLLLFGSRIAVTVKSGEAGVLFRTLAGGVETDKTFGEGFHLIAPWNNMYVYAVRQQELTEKMSVLSSNGLEISLDATLWHQPDFNDLPLLHQKKGENYINTIVKPSLRSATRSVIGRYTPEEIYSSKRDAIQDEIEVEIKKILESQYVQINDVLVRDITLPEKIKSAIEKKLQQEQKTLEYEFRLEKERKEAERRKIDAEGKAEANRILSASITTNILKEKGIEATNKLAESPNTKVVIIGNSKDGLPLILGDN